MLGYGALHALMLNRVRQAEQVEDDLTIDQGAVVVVEGRLSPSISMCMNEWQSDEVNTFNHLVSAL